MKRLNFIVSLVFILQLYYMFCAGALLLQINISLKYFAMFLTDTPSTRGLKANPEFPTRIAYINNIAVRSTRKSDFPT